MRKVMDGRKFPSLGDCSLVISGEESEVERAAVLHAVDVHGEKDTPEFHSTIRGWLEPESSFTPGRQQGEAPRASL